MQPRSTPSTTPLPTPTPSGVFYEAYDRELQMKRLEQVLLRIQEAGLRAFQAGNAIQVRLPPLSAVYSSGINPSSGGQIYEVAVTGRESKVFEVPGAVTLEFIEDPQAT